MRALKHLARLLLSLAVTVLMGGISDRRAGASQSGLRRGRTRTRSHARRGGAAGGTKPRGPSRAVSSPTRCATRPPCCRGDLGISRNWNRPVAGLLRERWPVTAQLMAVGILGGWALALVFALPGAIYPSPDLECLGRRSQRLAFVRAIRRPGAADLCLLPDRCAPSWRWPCSPESFSICGICCRTPPPSRM